MRDRLEGREFLGSDKFGNQYFQYFSYHGLPTRRRVYYRFFGTNKFHIDIHFVDWLFHRKAFPPTPNELDQLYLKDESRTRTALEWDEQEEAKQIEYREKQRLLKQQTNEDVRLLQTLGNAAFLSILLNISPLIHHRFMLLNSESNKESESIDDFTPVSWKAVANTRSDLKRYTPPEAVTADFREYESGIIEEHKHYQTVINKMGKDYDKVAHIGKSFNIYCLSFVNID